MTNRTILVTGGAGYIGSHACRALANAGYTPVVYDNLVYGHDWAVQWGPLEQGDLLDADKLAGVMEQYRPMAVMHFAAYAYVGESVSDPGKYYHNNVSGTLTLLRAMLDRGIDKLVFSSTCATYGNPRRDTLDESHPQDPVNPYGQSKLMVETILKDFDRAHGLRAVSLRYFNAAGASRDGCIGEEHDPETHLIPLALEAAAGKRGALTVFGSDYPTPDGTCIRDYIHVDDLAEAHVRALAALHDGGPGGAYNLGTGLGSSVKEVIDAIERVTDKRVPHEFGQRRAGDPPRLVADATLFQREFGWRPEHSDLPTIIESAWRWLNRSA